MNNNLLNQIASLQDMSIGELKEKWKTLYESDPPPYSRAFLMNRLAYRLQEIAYGGIPKKLEETILSYDSSQKRSVDPSRLTRGTRLVRIHQGIEHQVTVRDDGFEYQGQKFRSLSHIARVITGTRWNGLVFFGVKSDVRKRSKQ